MSANARPAAADGVLGRWILGVYAWLFALGFGASALDAVYARAIERAGAGEALAGVLNEIADLLQLPTVLTALAGSLALAAAIRRRLVRNLVIASLLAALAPLPALILFGESLAATGGGTWLRLGPGAAGSVLAMAAALSFRVSGSSPARD